MQHWRGLRTRASDFRSHAMPRQRTRLRSRLAPFFGKAKRYTWQCSSGGATHLATSLFYIMRHSPLLPSAVPMTVPWTRAPLRLASASAMPVSAALAAPLFSSVGQVYWERWSGSAIMLNLFKCSVATVLFACVVASQSTAPFATLSAKAVRMLAVSSFIGIVIGDAMWLQALSLIGARACILLGALQPCVAALAGAAFLGQPLHARLLLGTGLTSIGIVAADLGRTASLRAMVRRLATRLTALNDTWMDQLATQRRQQDEFGLPEACQGGDLVVANGAMLGLIGLLRLVLPSSSSATGFKGGGTERETAAGSEVDSPTIAVSQPAATDASAAPPDVSPPPAAPCPPPRMLAVGYTLALTNMVLDVLGATLTRAYGAGASTFEVNAIRFGFSSLVTACITAGAHLRAFAAFGRATAISSPTSSSSSAAAPAAAAPAAAVDVAAVDVAVDAAAVDVAAPPKWAMLPTLSTRDWRVVACGVVLVTFLCPALSNYALFRLPLGAWASLTALGPVYAIPIFYVLRGEVTRPLGILGAALASYGATIVSSSL